MAASTMRAVRVQKFGGPEVLTVEEVPVPKYGENEVLIKVYAAGVNPVETYVRQGLYSAASPKLPYTPGTDCAGVVEAIGKNVTKHKVGDRVFTTRKVAGSYAEYAVCPEDSCWRLSKALSFAQGAAVGIPYFTAYRSLHQLAQARPSQTILIHGASGAVGLASVQLARAHGMTVYGTAGTDEGLRLVERSGANRAFNHRKPEYMEELLKATNGKGFDLIFEMLANANLAKDCELIKFKGMIVIIGSRGRVEIDPKHLMLKDAKIMGMHLGHGTTEQVDWDDMGAALVAGFEQGTLSPVVDREYPLEKACDAHRDIIESSGAKGNLILNTELHI